MRTILAITFITFATQTSALSPITPGDLFFCSETENLSWYSDESKLTKYKLNRFKLEITSNNIIITEHPYFSDKEIPIIDLIGNILQAGSNSRIIKLMGEKFIYVDAHYGIPSGDNVTASLIAADCNKN